VPVSERDLLDLLWRRLSAPGVSGTRRYVMAEHVRYHPAWGRHIADAIALDTWGSGKYQIEGYEVKCTRSDWRRELPSGRFLDPLTNDVTDVPYAKSHPWRRHCARWYVLAPAGIIPRDELPDGWGLIEATSGRLRCTVQSADTHDGLIPLGAMQVAGLMRAVQQTAERHLTRSTPAASTPGL
jgi:hypothetical protein